MSNVEIQPESIEELREVIRLEPRVIPCGNRTKSPLSLIEDCSTVSVRKLSGLIEYEPSEFTFTAWAGSSISEIQSELFSKGQYLPFDPMLCEAGATLGGTIASGLSGPGRFRFGGVRDFLIGINWMEGSGQLIQGGGKVVKNAAGFDFPKFMVGSLGRFGVLVDVTFKVFPKPTATLTRVIQCSSHEDAAQNISDIAAGRWEADAIDYRPDLQQIALRLAGPKEVLAALDQEIQQRWPEGGLLADADAAAYWRQVTEFKWSQIESPMMVKVPINLTTFLKLQADLDANNSIQTHLSVGGNLAWLAVEDPQSIEWVSDLLDTHGLPAILVRVPDFQNPMVDASDANLLADPKLGCWQSNEMLNAVKHAMDPLDKFPGV